VLTRCVPVTAMSNFIQTRLGHGPSLNELVAPVGGGDAGGGEAKCRSQCHSRARPKVECGIVGELSTKPMTSYFSGFVDFVGAHPHYALTAVFLLALSEAIPVIGTVVPGSTLIVGISALAAGANVNPWLLLVAATLGAIAGDGLSFWLGQRYHREILLGWPLNRYPRFIDRSEAFINRYGVASVFLARFTAVVRAFVPLVAGILRMSPRQFYAANILSALAWAPAHVFPGVLLAMAISLAGASTEQLTVLIITGLIVVSAACRFLPGAIARFSVLMRHP
jgi:membrane protein DedA with SNARE-associated domain